MGSFFIYGLYFIGAETALNLLSRKNDKVEFVVKTVNFVLITFVSTLISISAAPYMILTNQRSSLNWLTSRTFICLAEVVLGITVEVENKELLDQKKPYIFIGNHQSALDLAYLAAIFPKDAVILAKKAIMYYPLIGWFMVLAGDIFISRGVKQSTRDMFKKASEILLKKKATSILPLLALFFFICVFFFPEGTRGNHPNGPDLLPFKKGAFILAHEAKVPIVPLVVSDVHNIFNSKLWRFKSGVMRVRVLPPILSTMDENCDLDDTIKTTWDLMHKTLLEISPQRV
ncbi:putative 1-acyl-sn-glycerol-3-phosphate acyltransferase [Smittium mucronatum]|uniref:Putative 1-acyl-sn-glycerol-3-phosphate acyltransferase n=1 Tax=Smittium mucronatum TaxID=133383 RepID=A0A1R0H5K9_9FUNG|nr:putative 1-acyl-sn-glycerol-3-phosphate acyltransferase [Smittium mucronatum]